MKIWVAGLDPAFSNFGMAKGILDISDGRFEFKEMQLAQTHKSTNKTIRTNCDDVDRCKQLYGAITEFLEGVSVVFAETPVGSQTAAAMKSYGVSVAFMGALEIPPIQVTASQVKAVTGDKNATKKQVIEWAAKEYSEAPWLPGKLRKGSNPATFPKDIKGKLLHKDNEHMADALAAIHAGVQTEEFIKILKLLEK